MWNGSFDLKLFKIKAHETLHLARSVIQVGVVSWQTMKGERSRCLTAIQAAFLSQTEIQIIHRSFKSGARIFFRLEGGIPSRLQYGRDGDISCFMVSAPDTLCSTPVFPKRFHLFLNVANLSSEIVQNTNSCAHVVWSQSSFIPDPFSLAVVSDAHVHCETGETSVRSTQKPESFTSGLTVFLLCS